MKWFSPAVDQSALMVKVCGCDLSFQDPNAREWAGVSAQQTPTKHVTVNGETAVTDH